MALEEYFYTSLFIIRKYFYTKGRVLKYNIGAPFFSTILPYSILPSSFTAAFLEHCLCKIKKVIVNTTGWKCF